MILEVQATTIDVSVVIPLYNERESIGILYDRLVRVLQDLGVDYEIIFVDDGSTDGSASVLKDIASRDSRVKVIEFRRNFGKSAALASGFRHARGRTIVTMDSDLQDDPEEIPRFLQKLEEGYDLVSGWKFPRQDPFFKRFASKVVNTLTNLVGGTSLHDMNCGFKAYRREVFQTIHLYGELHRYIPLLAYQFGFRIAEIKVKHHPRTFGKSKYNFPKQLAGVLDLATVLFLTRFYRKPLHLLGSFGAVFCGIGLLIYVYLGWLWLGGELIRNRPLLIIGMIMIIVGVQLFFFGLLAERLIYLQDPGEDKYVRSVFQGAEAHGTARENSRLTVPHG